MKVFSLTSSISDQMNFKDAIWRDARDILEALPFNDGQEDDAWIQDGDDLAIDAFDNFKSGIEVDDFEEAKAMYMVVFPIAVTTWQRGTMIDHLQDEMSAADGQGYIGMLIVVPGGQKDGLAYNPVVVDLVGLEGDGDQVAYRRSDDGHDDEWKVGSIEDAVEEALGQREALKGLEEELEQDQLHAEFLIGLYRWRWRTVERIGH